ncbi:STM3941 family protein [Pinibacter soli]|uniref:STM3941 family protein n=1 Tax=Pinibacter soli TaxID=3044211 RepID=A0ABT6REJ5_9BACT|nr:STM3941 family protein [Pinibacter soli]MDI3320989.1 STM3941 family protein [Pinibacter soli]
MKIQANKKRIPFLAIAGLILIVLLAMAMINVTSSEDASTQQRFYFYLFFIVPCIYYTSVSVIDYCKTTFNRKAMLSIEADGILDNLSIYSCGKIPWNDITEVKVKKAFNTNFLLIYIRNANTLISKQSKWKQQTLRGFQKKFGTPVIVAQTRIKDNVENIKDIMIAQLHKCN